MRLSSFPTLNGTRAFRWLLRLQPSLGTSRPQVAQSVFEMPWPQQLRLDEMKLLSLGAVQIDWDGAPLDSVSADQSPGWFASHHEDRVLWLGEISRHPR